MCYWMFDSGIKELGNNGELWKSLILRKVDIDFQTDYFT